MKRRIEELRTISKTGKIIGAVVVIAVIIGLIMWQSPTIISQLEQISNSNGSNLYAGYTKLTVVEGQVLVTTIGGYKYFFAYDPSTPQYDTSGVVVKGYVPTFAVNTEFKNPFDSTTYPASVGFSYNYSGIVIAVREVYSNYCILMVKSTVP